MAGLLAAGAAAIGCAGSTAPRSSPPAEPAPSTCVLNAGGAAPSTPFTAAFEDTADARQAVQAATRESPVRLDCAGRPTPGRARAWSRDTSGRFWTLIVDPGANTATDPGADTGARWTPSALVATWRSDPEAAAALWWSGVRSLVPLDERRLVLGLEAPSPDLPAFLADRALGVPRSPSPSRLTLAEPPSADLRDAIDAGADLVVSGDPALVDYARRRPGITVAALPWHRTYVLVLPVRSAGLGSAIPADTAGFQAALARDAVRADARAAGAPYWWDGREACPARAGRTPGRAVGAAIVYAGDDPVARDLAERLVALAGSAVTARGLAADSLASALRSESQRGYVLSLPRHAPVPCRETAAWPAGAAVIPLVDTRPYALIRNGAPALAVDWDGAIRLAEPGDVPGAAP